MFSALEDYSTSIESKLQTESRQPGQPQAVNVLKTQIDVLNDVSVYFIIYFSDVYIYFIEKIDYIVFIFLGRTFMEQLSKRCLNEDINVLI